MPCRTCFALALIFLFAAASAAFGHCDTMDGPVVKEAQAALDKGDPTPVLKWVQKDKEDQVRQAFQKTLTVRTKGPEARELADQFFFETLVRLHRAGEGAPYTGLKPAGTPLEPGIAEADKALATGKVEDLVKAAQEAVAAGLKQRFAAATAAKAHADHDVDSGRKFVAAYVEFVHYVERLFAAASTSAGGHEAAGHDTPPTTQPADHHH